MIIFHEIDNFFITLIIFHFLAGGKYICRFCRNELKICEKNSDYVPLFGKENETIPGPQPKWAQNLTQMEELLVAPILTMMSIYTLSGGSHKAKGNCINFEQNIEEITDTLPRVPMELDVLIIRANHHELPDKTFSVNRKRVETFLRKAVEHKLHGYEHITISSANIARLPENGIPELRTITDNTLAKPLISAGPIDYPDTDTKESDIDQEEQMNLDDEEEIESEEDEEDNIKQFGISNPGDQLLETDKIKNILKWPTRNLQPANEFTTINLAAKAFPTLFANKTGDPTNRLRNRPIKFDKAIRYLLKYAYQKENGDWYYPFAAHPRFAFWALNYVQRHRAMNAANTVLKFNVDMENLTITEIQNILNDSNHRPEGFINKLQLQTRHITGSSPYWYAHCQNLRHLMEQKGAATLFITYSMADLYWPDLHRLLGTEGQGMAARRKAVNENPHIVTSYFIRRVRDFNKHYMQNSLNMKWCWFRYENQNRGTIHCHMMCKLSNDPNLIKLCKQAFFGDKAAKEKASGNITNENRLKELDILIRDGKLAKDKVITYIDTLITTCNPLDQEQQSQHHVATGLQHSCAQRIHNYNDDQLETDYMELVNSVQRHKTCSTYCRRYKKGKAYCRFKFPFDLQPSTTIDFTENRNGNFKVDLKTQRNDPIMNKHNRCQLQNFRSNVDMQIVLDYAACVDYIAKYAAKAEKKSETIQEVLSKLILKFHDDTDDVKKAFRSMMIATLGQRDKSHQEAIQILMSQCMPMVECNKFEFKNVSLLQQRRIFKLFYKLFFLI